MFDTKNTAQNFVATFHLDECGSLYRYTETPFDFSLRVRLIGGIKSSFIGIFI